MVVLAVMVEVMDRLVILELLELLHFQVDQLVVVMLAAEQERQLMDIL
jgi:hypothetical protein